MRRTSVRQELGRRHVVVTVVLRTPSSYRSGLVESATQQSPWSTGVVVSIGPPTSANGVLADAVGHPMHPECTEPIQLTGDGNATPLLCRTARVDVGAWDFYARLRPAVLALGRTVTRCQATDAMEGVEPGGHRPDLEGITYPEEYASFELARAYYGWRFSVPFPGLNPPGWLSTCGTSAVRAWTG